MRQIPEHTLEYNSKYSYLTGDEEQYKTVIIIDELNDDLVVTYDPEVSEWSSCNCKGFLMRKKPCKHMKEVINQLNLQGIKTRFEDEPKTEE